MRGGREGGRWREVKVWKREGEGGGGGAKRTGDGRDDGESSEL